MSAFAELLLKDPGSFEAAYGRARALNAIAEEGQDVVKVREAIAAHETLIEEHGMDLDDAVYEQVASTCLERLKFLGKEIHDFYISK